MEMDIRFPGGLAVEAQFKGFNVVTDQPFEAGGTGTALAPFDLFLTSIGTCAGYFALRFCQKRNLDTAGLGVRLYFDSDPEAHRVTGVQIEVRLPEGFPPKYRDALVRAVDQCTVKRNILEPPQFEVTTVLAAPEVETAEVAEVV